MLLKRANIENIIFDQITPKIKHKTITITPTLSRCYQNHSISSVSHATTTPLDAMKGTLVMMGRTLALEPFLVPLLLVE